MEKPIRLLKNLEAAYIREEDLCVNDSEYYVDRSALCNHSHSDFFTIMVQRMDNTLCALESDVNGLKCRLIGHDAIKTGEYIWVAELREILFKGFEPD